MEQRKLISISGQGFGYSRANGKFEFRIETESKVFEFTKLKDAQEFCDKHKNDADHLHPYKVKQGLYQVTWEKHRVETFTKLSEAYKLYKALKVPFALWDMTTIPELIDCKVYK